MPPFTKILIANRGEIALRVIRTARELGLKTVAVFSDADRSALHVRRADEAYPLGDPTPAASYLNSDKLLAIAKQSGADAVHPGYGFLSENADFAEQCEKAGLTFIGPTHHNIRLMGDKIAARRALEKTDVPRIPGNQQPSENADRMAKDAEKIGYPVIIKAVGGGGGRGIRIVANEKALREAFDVATSEAKNAFGNGKVYLEKFVSPVRHVEVQILADEYGSVIHLGERECSIQRRRQKLIEEAPCQFITPETRAKLCEAAVSISQAIAYRGAGTVEFIVDDEQNFYFLEMNTRLQVEHPITEATTGVDLVQQQIRVAMGEPLAVRQSQTRARGAAMEVRIYAEDPSAGFAPSIGTIRNLNIPGGPNVRVDSGLFDGMEVSLYYDPLIAKLVVWGRDRAEVITRMRRALKEFTLSGIRTTIPLLRFLLERDDFAEGAFSTEYLERLMSDGAYTAASEQYKRVALLAAAVSQHERAGKRVATPTGPNGGATDDPWTTAGRSRLRGGGQR